MHRYICLCFGRLFSVLALRYKSKNLGGEWEIWYYFGYSASNNNKRKPSPSGALPTTKYLLHGAQDKNDLFTMWRGSHLRGERKQLRKHTNIFVAAYPQGVRE
eukprot:GEMP01087186.1.p3 GENE.GEMP01087186.1~~GEMP01087186.1.p3  ORF type:complete len:103 (-),score=4.72 GEMP01087186.1:483-791(-)